MIDRCLKCGCFKSKTKTHICPDYIWSEGLTKYMDERLRKSGEKGGLSRLGKSNVKGGKTLKRLYAKGKLVNPMEGKHHTYETKEKIRLLKLGKSNPKCSETKRKLFKEGKLKLWNDGLCGEEYLKHFKDNKHLSSGKHLSEETKNKIRISKVGKVSAFLGKHHTEESKKKQREAHKGKHHSPKTEFTSEGLKEKWKDLEYVEKMSKIRKRLWETPEFRIKMIEAHLKVWQRPEYREKKLKELREHWKDPEFREKVLKATFDGLKVRPTSLDRQFTDDFIIKHNLPYKYVGDGSFHLGWKYPDFIDINGEKVCVEVRSIKVTKHLDKMTPEEYEQERVEHFAKYGWKCLVFFADRIAKRKWKFEKSDEEILKELKGTTV